MKSPDSINRDNETDCEDCPLVPNRREFLRSVSALALGAIALGLPIRSASAKVLASSVAGRKQLSYPLPATDGAVPDRQRASDASLLRRVQVATQRIRELETDNKRLRDALAEALGERRVARSDQPQHDTPSPRVSSPIRTP